MGPLTRGLLAAAAFAAAACTPGPAIEPADPPLDAGGATSQDAALATEPATGAILLAWVGGDSAGYRVYATRTADLRAWAPAVAVTPDAHDVHPHAEASPRWGAAPGALGLAWVRQIPAPGRRFPASVVRFARSTDGGGTWSEPVTLNDDTAAGLASHTFHGAAWMGDSSLVVAWLESRPGPLAPAVGSEPDGGGHDDSAHAEGRSNVWLARSDDGGRTWRANRGLWGSACPCCRVSLTRRPDGGVVAAWRQHFPGSVRDVVVAELAGEEAGSRPARVADDGWVYPGCPHTGPAVAVDARGVMHVAWFTGPDGGAGVRYARRGPDGGEAMTRALLSARRLPAAHPALAVWPDGRALVAWDVTARGRSRLELALIRADGSVGWRRTVRGTDGADHPSVAVGSDGTAAVAWTERRGGTSRVRVLRVRWPMADG
jgi:hypothetical protein